MWRRNNCSDHVFALMYEKEQRILHLRKPVGQRDRQGTLGAPCRQSVEHLVRHLLPAHQSLVKRMYRPAREMLAFMDMD
jgi:hypothetical protein